MADIEIDTNKLDAELDYFSDGWFGISILYDGKVIKKIENKQIVMADRAEKRALEAYPEKITAACTGGNEQLRSGYVKGYHQAEKDILSEYGWLVSKVKILKLRYCHNREAVKAVEEACDILNELETIIKK